MILTRTPFRISLLGGGTDYPEWSVAHGGAVLTATLAQYCWVMARRTTAFGSRYRAVYSRTENADSLEEVRHPAVRECLRHLEVDGCEVVHTSDLPARSGVGSSSAFVVGLLNALHALRGHRASPGRLAAEAVRVEREVLRETVGCQDQYATAHGGLNLITFPAGGGTPAVASVLPKGALALSLQGHLLLFYTGLQRTSSDVAKGYLADMVADVPAMTRMREMAALGAACVRESDLGGLGALLREAWLLKRGLKGVSTPAIDVLYDKALAAGALAGKVLGAGGGGFLLLLAPPESQGAVRGALADLTEVEVTLEHQGSTVVYNSTDQG